MKYANLPILMFASVYFTVGWRLTINVSAVEDNIVKAAVSASALSSPLQQAG